MTMHDRYREGFPWAFNKVNELSIRSCVWEFARRENIAVKHVDVDAVSSQIIEVRAWCGAVSMDAASKMESFIFSYCYFTKFRQKMIDRNAASAGCDSITCLSVTLFTGDVPPEMR